LRAGSGFDAGIREFPIVNVVFSTPVRISQNLRGLMHFAELLTSSAPLLLLGRIGGKLIGMGL